MKISLEIMVSVTTMIAIGITGSDTKNDYFCYYRRLCGLSTAASLLIILRP